ncbi:MAG TPA: Verru_Chthon cassette protein A, partial [Candidatus Methylacidiphilales bacterium]|nr:Verru_Chthon cassette protein A [Candidatus Methylacidiphilales bacterium]
MRRSPQNAEQRRTRRRGVALIAVLLCLMLLTVLLAAFLSAGAIEAKHAKVYTDGAKVNLLAQTAVNVVIAEIKEGTAGVDSTGGTLAWASQPGMIRTYAGDGTPGNYYKLYSAANMMGNGAPDPAEDLTAMDRWDDSPSFFTDLNSPVDVGGTERYPIISGNNLTAFTTPYSTSALTYQTADPGKPDIEGFWVENGPVGGIPPTTAATSRVPMPVQWLYVLQDGSVLAPEPGTGRKATISAATLQNPIVGRIAFWTDDESSKVNINTASEGIYMDTPRVATVPEFKLANFQPAQHEFQRYPGHPAMTSLSTVLGAWLPLPAGGSTGDVYKGVTPTTYASHLKPYYDLTPKMPTGIPAGSQGSTVKASAPLDVASARRQPLYTSVDELIFDVNRSANNAALNEQALEETRFFLTANSRSPDVNLYNTPRVCIWPISGIDDNAHRSPLDRLIGFCTTVNAMPYYFQRSDYSSPTKDISIARNAQLLTYLRHLGQIPVPGFGGTFATKYGTRNPTNKGSDLDQIYTQIFDYIRIANLSDQTVTAPFTVIGGVSQNEVVPSLDTTTDTKGFGRFLTVSQAALVFIATADGDWNKANPLFYKPGTPPAKPEEGQRRLQAALLLSLFDPALGYPMMKPDPSKLVVRVTDLNSMTWNTVDGSQSMGFADTQLNVSTFNYVAPNTNRSYGGTWGPAPLFIDTKLNGKSTTNDGPPLSAQADVPTASGLLSFGGGTATVKIYYTDSAGAQNL